MENLHTSKTCLKVAGRRMHTSHPTPRQGRREKIRAPGQRYDAGPLGTKI